MMDFEQARENMIEQQIRTWDVLDLNVLDLISSIHREEFVPNQYKSLALADTEIPIDHEQVTLSPKMEARILQALQIQPHETILEIGTGCGYLTALLAKSGKSVKSVELFESLSHSAKSKLEENAITNVEFAVEDIFEHLPQINSYHIIVITGSLPIPVDAFCDALKRNGRLFSVIGDSPVMEAMVTTKLEADSFRNQSLFETQIPALIGAPQKPTFHF